MKLYVRRLKLKPDIERLNKHAILERKRRMKIDIARGMSLPLENYMVDIIYTAKLKRLRSLKTKNIDLINKADTILYEFDLRITNAA